MSEVFGEKEREDFGKGVKAGGGEGGKCLERKRRV